MAYKQNEGFSVWCLTDELIEFRNWFPAKYINTLKSKFQFFSVAANSKEEKYKMIQTISLLLLASMLSSVVEGSYFTANKPSRQRDPLNRRQYFLKFQNVLTNSDGSFLPEYGAYSAPFPGYYCFELCVPKTGRRGKISLYKFSNNGPEKIITLKPRNSAKCYK